MSELKDRILDTALHLFAEHGYHGITVNQIVAACGTSKGGFYHNFQSKDELLYRIHDLFISYVLKKAEEAYATHETPTAKLFAIIASFVKVFDLYKPHITVFYQESVYLKGEYAQRLDEKRDQFRYLLRSVVQEGTDCDEFRQAMPVDLSVMAILGMVNWLYKWYQQEGVKTIDEIAAAFADFALHALLTDGAKQVAAYKAYFL